MTGQILGLNPTRVDDEAVYKPGMLGMDDEGNWYRYARAVGSVRVNNFVGFSQTWEARAAASNNTGSGAKLGVSSAAFNGTDYGWFMVDGVAQAEVNGAVSAGGVATVTAEGGRITDGGTAANHIEGVHFPAGIADNATGPVILTHPHRIGA